MKEKKRREREQNKKNGTTNISFKQERAPDRKVTVWAIPTVYTKWQHGRNH